MDHHFLRPGIIQRRFSKLDNQSQIPPVITLTKTSTLVQNHMTKLSSWPVEYLGKVDLTYDTYDTG